MQSIFDVIHVIRKRERVKRKRIPILYIIISTAHENISTNWWRRFDTHLKINSSLFQNAVLADKYFQMRFYFLANFNYRILRLTKMKWNVN